MMTFAFFSSVASGLCFGMLHTELAVSMIGILKRECAVRPPGNMIAALPEEATAIAMPFSARTADKNKNGTKMSFLYLQDHPQSSSLLVVLLLEYDP